MPVQSAGLLVYRNGTAGLEVFLVHPGGPFFKNKDNGAWSIPKGEIDPADGSALDSARREFSEETGMSVDGAFTRLASRKLASGKIVHAWAVEGSFDASKLRSNTFTIEWPPRSGTQKTFPEIDRGEWFAMGEARKKINAGQLGFLDELESRLSGDLKE
jgi:predicted NUDIX family NTP pyrophosphohydrolase